MGDKYIVFLLIYFPVFDIIVSDVFFEEYM